MSKASDGSGKIPADILGKPFIGEPNTACTETYLVIGTYDDYNTACNVCTYISTKFFRFMVSFVKNTQDGTAKVYRFVPVIDLTKSWTDTALYAYFNLDKDEIALIESTIKPMQSDFKNPYENMGDDNG